MNGLSWLLYLSEALDGLRNALTAGSLIVLGAGTFGGAMWAGMGSEIWSWDSEATKAFKTALPGKIWKALRRLWIIAPICFCVGLLLPSKTTLMLIAASEVGETVLASKDVQNIGGEAGALATDSLRLLRKYVSEQLGETEAN